MSNVIDSFLVALGFEIDAKGVAEFEQHIENARNTVTTMVTAAGVAATAIGAFVYSVADGIDELGDFADRNQVGVAALQELGHAAQLNGSSLEAVKGSVAGLNSVIGQALTGVGRGAKMFEKFGLEAKNADGSVKGFDQVLEEVSKRMEGMDRKEAMAMATKLGIDASLVPMLQSGAENIKALREEARAFGVTSEDDAKAAGAFMDAIDRLKFMAGALKNALATGLMPIMTQLIDRFKTWYMANREVIQQRLEFALNVITTALGYLWTWLYRLVSGVIGVVEWLSKFKIVTYLATAALAAFVAIKVGVFWNSLAAMVMGAARSMMAFNASALLIPMVIGAIIIAIGLLIDDFMTWREGGQSVIGDVAAEFPSLLEVINAVADAVDVVVAFFKQQWEVLKQPIAELAGHLSGLAVVVLPILGAVFRATFQVLGDALSFILPMLVRIIGAVIELATVVASWLVRAFNYAASVAATFRAAFGAAVGFVMGLFDQARSRVMGFVDSVAGAINTVAKLLGLSGFTVSIGAAVSQAPGVAVPGGAGGTIPNRYAPTGGAGSVLGKGGNSIQGGNKTVSNSGNTTVTQHIKVSSTDPVKAGKEVASKTKAMAYAQSPVLG